MRLGSILRWRLPFAVAVAPAKSSSLSDAPARDMDGWTLGAIAVIDSEISVTPVNLRLGYCNGACERYTTITITLSHFGPG